jgi:DNA invertase Pin-like site-specific DNA recombinase
MTAFEKNNIVESSIPTHMDKYVIYLRKSRADVEAEKLGEGETLARHKKILTELAARKGLYVEKIYEEIVSGETIEARPEIQKMIQECYDGKYKGIIIVEVTRLSRGNQGDAQIILDCLKYSNRNNGVLVITPTKTYDVAHSQEDEEYMEFELFMSRREYKMIQKRMDRGRKQAVVEGNFMGSYRPYGYNILKTKTSRTLIPNPDEAPYVKKIYEWAVVENLSPYKIAKRLDNMGVPTYYGDVEWSKDTIKTILTNPTYIGKVRWNDRMQVKTMSNGELVTSRPRSNHTDHYMEYDGKHLKDALIDEETFHKAKSRFATDSTKSNLKLANPLAGILKCKNCGRVLAYQSYKSRKTYTPPRYNHVPSQRCKVKSVVVDDVLKAVIHALKLYIEDFELKLDNIPDSNENEISKQIELMRKEIQKIERKLSKLFDSWEDERITDNEFVKRKTVHNRRIESIKEEIENLEYSIPEKEEYQEKIVLLSEALQAINDDTLDAEIKNEYLKRIINTIEFSRENNSEFILDINLH